MNNFESVNTYQSTQSSNVSTPVVSNSSDYRSLEIPLDREIETPIIKNEQLVEEEKVENTREYADSILEYSKQNGLQKAFEKLANGERFDEPTEEVFSDDQEEVEEVKQNENNAEYNKFTNKSVESYQVKPVQESILDYLSPELARDPLYTQKIGEVAGAMISEGRELNPEEIKEEAFKRYLDAKNSDLPPTLEGKISAIEEEFRHILQENDELRKELEEFKSVVKTQSETMGKMAEAMLELAKKLHQEKEDEEEKITLFELMVRLMALIMQEMVNYEDENKKQSINSKNNNAKTILQLPNIKIGSDKKPSASSQQNSKEKPIVTKS